MSQAPATRALDKIAGEAKRRHESAKAGKTRLVVQVGHCSLSVGAAEVASTLAESIPESAYLATAGCDGACYAAPQVLVTDASGNQGRSTQVDVTLARDIAGGNGVTSIDDGYLGLQQRIALDGCGEIDVGLDEYLVQGGYSGLAKALSMSPEEVIEEVKASGLQGRGGAYFPAGAKWEGARAVDASPKYMVVNAEEGEPGIFKDRHIMEGVPHRMLEGTIVAAYATGIETAYIYINAEANVSADRVQKAVDEAYSHNLLGPNILDSGFALDVEIRRGAGGYVCGEETTLLNTMEGYRREPRLRPPFPTESGYLAKPTVINNCETLASVPFILRRGAREFAKIGTEKATGTKIVSLSGSVQRSGIVEVPMGTTLRQIVEDVGGGPTADHTLTAVAVGGPSSGVFPPSMLDTPIGPGLLHDSGVMLGAGGVIAIDERTSVVEVVRALAAYNAAESCGKCTPCREGTPRMVEAIDRLTSGRGTAGDMDELRYLAEVVGLASLCGLGQAAGGPITSALHFFGDEIALLGGLS